MRLSGITRDTELNAAPKLHVRDFLARAGLSDDHDDETIDLVITLRASAGATTEAVGSRMGFRRVEDLDAMLQDSDVSTTH